jgi:thiol-disulfide isomerase/thioredoxin
MSPTLKRIAAMAALSLGLALSAGAESIKPVPAPSWTLKDVDGKPVAFSQFKGKVVVINFWATWCPPCRTEIPGYVALQKKYAAEGLVFIGISVDGDDEVGRVKSFVKEFNINYLILMADDTIQESFHLDQGYPTSFIIDRDGKIRNKKVGREPTPDYEKEILAVLRPPGA